MSIKATHRGFAIEYLFHAGRWSCPELGLKAPQLHRLQSKIDNRIIHDKLATHGADVICTKYWNMRFSDRVGMVYSAKDGSANVVFDDCIIDAEHKFLCPATDENIKKANEIVKLKEEIDRLGKWCSELRGSMDSFDSVEALREYAAGKSKKADGQ